MNRRMSCSIGAIVALLTILCQASPALGATVAWPMYRHDAQQTGRSTHFGPATPHQTWETSAGAAAVVGGDGTIYVPGAGSLPGTLRALGPDGTQKWEFVVPGTRVGVPAVAGDGTVYVTFGVQLYALTPSGTKKWSRSFDRFGPIPVIGPDGTVYVGVGDSEISGGKLYAVSPSGAQKWVFTPNAQHVDQPAVAANGTIYATAGGYLYALSPAGAIRWRFPNIAGSASIGGDGTIYAAGTSSKFYAIKPDGSKKWEFSAAAAAGDPAVGGDGTVYFGCADGRVYALSPTGIGRWTFETSAPVSAPPAVGSDGIVYAGSTDHKLYALKANGTMQWSFDTSAVVDFCPAIGPDGTVLVSDRAGGLHALGYETAQPTTVTIRTSSTNPRVGTQFVLSGLVTPSPDLTGKLMHVEVKKPGKSYWSYSSNRLVYSGAGGAASWQYKYTLIRGMTRGTYYFRAVLDAGAGYRTSSSRIIAVMVR